MHVEDHHGIDDLRRMGRVEKNARLRVRLQAIVLAKRGRTAPEVADALGVSRRTIQQWIRRYNDTGIDGLRHRPGQGRRSKLSSKEKDSLIARIERGALSEDQVCTLRGRDFQRILEREFGKLYRLSSVYALLHRLGYSCLMPRPQHRQADENAQRAFKKKSPQESNRSVKPIPTGASKSGSRTKRGSANKVR